MNYARDHTSEYPVAAAAALADPGRGVGRQRAVHRLRARDQHRALRQRHRANSGVEHAHHAVGAAECQHALGRLLPLDDFAEIATAMAKFAGATAQAPPWWDLHAVLKSWPSQGKTVPTTP